MRKLGVITDYFSLKIAEALAGAFLRELQGSSPQTFVRMVSAAREHGIKFELSLAAAMQGLAYIIFPLLPHQMRDLAEDGFARIPSAIVQQLRVIKERPIEDSGVPLEQLEGLSKEYVQTLLASLQAKKDSPPSLWDSILKEWRSMKEHRLEFYRRKIIEYNRRHGYPENLGLAKPGATLAERHAARLEAAEYRLQKMKEEEEREKNKKDPSS